MRKVVPLTRLDRHRDAGPEPGRRDVLQGLVATAGLAAVGMSVPSGTAADAGVVFQARFGAADVTILSDGHLSLGLGFALPQTDARQVQALLESAGLPTDGLRPPINVTVVRSAGEVVLIDAGAGSHFMATAGALPAALETAGIAPESVTKVVFTHAHPDHLWGALDEFDEPRFAKAEHLVSVAEWDYWTNPDTVGRVPAALQGMAAGSARILKVLEPVMRRIRPGDQVAEGLSIVDTAGHTPGHVSVLLESGGQRLLVGGDSLSHPVFSFARPRWIWGADAEAERAVATRVRLLDMLATDRVDLIGYHLTWPGLGRVERKEGEYRFLSRS